MNEEYDDENENDHNLKCISEDDFISDDYDIEQLFKEPENEKEDENNSRNFMKFHEI